MDGGEDGVVGVYAADAVAAPEGGRRPQAKGLGFLGNACGSGIQILQAAADHGDHFLRPLRHAAGLAEHPKGQLVVLPKQGALRGGHHRHAQLILNIGDNVLLIGAEDHIRLRLQNGFRIDLPIAAGGHHRQSGPGLLMVHAVGHEQAFVLIPGGHGHQLVRQLQIGGHAGGVAQRDDPLHLQGYFHLPAQTVGNGAGAGGGCFGF